ncbi:MAG: hypothetical protein KDA96_06700, partial [Planctomycetaceae bacterium]|nr:hypothetical protein [Planctomycetaceae bacterium]
FLQEPETHAFRLIRQVIILQPVTGPKAPNRAVRDMFVVKWHNAFATPRLGLRRIATRFLGRLPQAGLFWRLWPGRNIYPDLRFCELISDTAGLE